MVFPLFNWIKRSVQLAVVILLV